MTAYRPCPTPGCPALIAAGHTQCDNGHGRPRNASWSRNRNSTAQARMRREGLARTGGQCEHCGTTENLRACHITPLSQGGSYEQTNCRMLCKACDKASDPYAR